MDLVTKGIGKGEDLVSSLRVTYRVTADKVAGMQKYLDDVFEQMAAGRMGNGQYRLCFAGGYLDDSSRFMYEIYDDAGETLSRISRMDEMADPKVLKELGGTGHLDDADDILSAAKGLDGTGGGGRKTGNGGKINESGSKTIQSINELSDEQIAALRRYTGDDYVNINNSLRGMETLSLENQATVEAMKSALDNVALSQDMILYRGTSKEALGSLQNLPVDQLIGKTFKEQGFMSTSTNCNVIDSFLGDMQITIEASKGAHALDISSISQYSTEAEVLFNAGQEMLITSAEVKNGILHINVILK